MRDAEHAPYRVKPAQCLVDAWVVVGTLSRTYPILAYQGTERECEVVARALNELAAIDTD